MRVDPTERTVTEIYRTVQEEVETPTRGVFLRWNAAASVPKKKRGWGPHKTAKVANRLCEILCMYAYLPFMEILGGGVSLEFSTRFGTPVGASSSQLTTPLLPRCSRRKNRAFFSA